MSTYPYGVRMYGDRFLMIFLGVCWALVYLGTD